MLALYGIAIFTGAGLLFLVQPMIAKQLVPHLGGSPAVWNTCMLFFQASLLVGYFYAHLLARLTNGRAQLIAHGIVVVGAGIALPIGIPENVTTATDGSPVEWILTTLTTSVGAPFFVLASASPLLQSWFARSSHRRAADPYFLYAASNAGSMLALLGYPFVIEPNIGLGDQLVLWSLGFVGFATLALACATPTLLPRRSPIPVPSRITEEPERPAIPHRRRAAWIALAFIPSSLVLGVTQHISTDIAPSPLLWVIPLAIYLLTFIVAFSRAGPSIAKVSGHLVPVVVVLVGALMAAKIHSAIGTQIATHLTALGIIGLAFHGRLAAKRPEAARLTEFYLCLSLGGVLGGVFNAVLAPIAFDFVAEYPLVLLSACALRPRRPTTDGAPTKTPWWSTLVPRVEDFVVVTMMLALVFARDRVLSSFTIPDEIFGVPKSDVVDFALPALGCLLLLRRPRQLALALAILLATPHVERLDGIIYADRTFFGVHRVIAQDDGSGRWHHLWHGSTGHGSQYSQVPWSQYATRYYTDSGPAGDLMLELLENDAPRSLALVGLGIGTLAAYGRPHWDLTFYEIDPEVVRIAEDPELFTYTSDCKSKIRFVVGDARIRLTKSVETSDTKYDAIFLDAFSSDAIPIHMLTREAIEIYIGSLKPNGFLAFHISNRHLNLETVLANIAAESGLSAAVRHDMHISAEERTTRRKNPSVWAVLARDDQSLGSLADDPRWPRMEPDRKKRTWTDDFSNILGALK